MTAGYVFKAGAEQAISNQRDGANLPSPKNGAWVATKTVPDVYAAGLIGFDAEKFTKVGYQILPA